MMSIERPSNRSFNHRINHSHWHREGLQKGMGRSVGLDKELEVQKCSRLKKQFEPIL